MFSFIKYPCHGEVFQQEGSHWPNIEELQLGGKSVEVLLWSQYDFYILEAEKKGII